MTALSLGEQQLWINEVHHQANEKVRVCIYSSDVSLTLSKPEQTSIRNILRGQIVQIIPQENRIDIAVLVEGHKVWAVSVNGRLMNCILLKAWMFMYK